MGSNKVVSFFLFPSQTPRAQELDRPAPSRGRPRDPARPCQTGVRSLESWAKGIHVPSLAVAVAATVACGCLYCGWGVAFWKVKHVLVNGIAWP